ncbi:IPT/TIG domain-containing protein [Streptomyces scopuliridis]|uniref:IPT/TIG domain-containing protein n=1 Tax=Streptomyces scopuliridis TaxID=452529 RepID=UPI0036B77A38
MTVTTPGGNSNPEPFFYVNAPWVTSVSPAAGQFVGGGSVTITGLNLATVQAVDFGSNAGTITGVSDTTVTVTVPRADSVGTVPVTVIQSPGGNTDMPSAYTCLAGPGI